MAEPSTFAIRCSPHEDFPFLSGVADNKPVANEILTWDGQFTPSVSRPRKELFYAYH
jgi:hypothetical protein